MWGGGGGGGGEEGAPILTSLYCECRFVEYATIREMESAIQLFNDLDVGGERNLVVKVKEDRERRNERMAWMKSEQEFLNSLNATGELDDMKCSDNIPDNPLEPRYISRQLSSPEKPTPPASESTGPGHDLLGSSGGASSLKASPPRAEDKTTDSNPTEDKAASTGKEKMPCHVCKKPTRLYCQNCKVPYCSKTCQSADWAVHTKICGGKKNRAGATDSPSSDSPPSDSPSSESRLPKAAVADPEVPGPLLIAETIDDPGFYVSNGSQEDSNFLSEVDMSGGRHAEESSKASPIPATPPDSPPQAQNASNVLSPSVSCVQTEASQAKVEIRERDGHRLSIGEVLSVFEQCPSPLSSLPVGELPPKEFTGIITSVYSSTQFHAVVASASVKDALTKLVKYGASVSPDICAQIDLKEGSLYGYIDDHGDFYRVQLTSKSGSVSLFDIGMRITVQTAQLFHLSQEIKSIPQLCFQMTLHNLYYDAEKKREGTQYLFSLLKGRPFSFFNHSVGAYKSNREINFITTSITSLDGSTVIADLVAENNFAKAIKRNAGSDGKSPSPTKRGPLLSKPLFIDGSPDKMGPLRKVVQANQQLTNQVADDRPQTPPTSPQDSSTGTKYKLVQMASKVPFHNPQVGVMIEIRPLVVLNPNIIWAQVIHDNVSNFMLMESDLNKVYSSRDYEPYVPAPGEICAAKFAQDQKYYRVEVMCVNNSGTVDIRFVDHGNSETVTMNQIRHLEPVFLSLPKQALHFSVAGVAPAGNATSWNDTTVAYLKERILNRKVLVKIVMQTPSTCMVEMWDPDSPSDLISTSLVELGLAQPQQVYGVFGDGIGNAPLLRGVSISTRQDEPRTVPSPSPNIAESAPVLLKPKDFERPNSPAVLRLDSSMATNTPPSPHSNSADSPAPPATTKSSGWSPAKPTAPPSDVSVTKAGGWSPLKLVTPSSISTTSGRSPVKPATPNSISSATTATKSSPSSKLGGGGKVTIDVIDLEPSGEPVEAVVVYVESPLKFFIQLVNDKEAVERHVKMAEALAQAHLDPHLNPSHGDLCICRHPSSGNVYRAKIIHVEANSVMVQFLDRGDRKKIPRNTIFKMREEFASTPAQAVHCTLNQLLNPSGKGNPWKEEAMDFFKAKVGATGAASSITVRCIKIISTMHVVNVTTSADNGSRDLLEWMVEEKLGGSILNKKGGRSDSVDKGRQRMSSGTNFSTSPSNQSNSSRSPPDRASRSPPQVRASPLKSDPPSRQQLISPSSTVKKQLTSLMSSLHSAGDNAGRQKQVSFDLPQRSSRVLVSDLKVSRPKDETFHLLVIDISSPQEFYVQTVENSDALDNLFTSLNNHFSTNKFERLSQPPSVGSLVCAKFSADGAWYRSEVMEISENSCRVKFIDYGNTDVVSLSEMAECPPNFVSLPILSCRCSLGGVALPPGDITWSDDATQLLKKLSSGVVLQGRAIDGDCSPLAVELTNGDVDLASELVKAGLAAFSKSNSGKNEVADTSPKVASLENVSLPPGHEAFSLLVTEVYNPSEFYIQTAASSEPLDELFTSLNNHFSTNKCECLSQPPSVGSLVCAKFSADGAWYRSEVMEISGNSCRVKFIDYGNTDVVSLSEMAECPPDFVSLPVLSCRCSLGGVAPPPGDITWSDDATQLLKKLSSGVVLQGRAIDGDCSPLAVELTNGDVDLASELVKAGLAKKCDQNDEPVSQVVGPNATTYPLVTYLGEVPLPPSHEAFNLLVTEVYSPSEFYIQTAASSEPLDELFTSLNNHFSTNKFERLSQSPSVGSLVCAKFSADGAWYRSEVMDISGDSCRVKFIDYGNTDVVSLSEMAECPPNFVSLPILSCRCSLGGVAPPPGDITWSDDATQLLKKLSSGVVLQGRAIDGDCSPLAVELTNGDVDLASELVKAGLAAFSKSNSGKNEVADTSPKVASLENVSLPPGHEAFSLLVTEVYNPSEFYIQTAASSEPLDELFTSLNNHFSTNKCECLSQPPSVGSLVCAKFSADGAWYRSEVMEISGNSCRVKFIDYGNTDVVSLSEMAECPPDFVSLPVLSCRCSLGGVAPPPGDITWSDDATQLLKEKSANRVLQGSIEDGAVYPPLIQLKDDTGADLASMLIARGVAVALTPPIHEPLPPPQLISMSELGKPVLPDNSNYFSVLVTDVSSPEDFSIQKVDVETISRLEEMQTSLQRYFQEHRPSLLSLPPSPGSLVCALYSENQAWHRAEVLETKDSCSKVRFIDFGNTEVVQVEKLSACPVEFTKHPPFASRCTLSGISLDSSEGGASSWSSKSVAVFVELVGGGACVLNAKVAGESIDDKTPVELVNTSGSSDVDVALEMISQGFATSGVVLSDIPTIQLPIGVPVDIRVTEVDNPGSFYVLYCERKSILGFKDMMTELQSTYNSYSSKYQGFPAKVGGVCCCQSIMSSDKSWHRCRVTEVMGKTATVFCFDYGFTEVVFVDDLLHLDPKFSSLPAQAVRCCLTKVNPPSAFGWNEVSVSFFKSLVKGNTLRAIVETMDVDSKKAVSLSTSEGDIAAALIEHGYASGEGPVHTPPKSSSSTSHHKPGPTKREQPLPPLPLPLGSLPTTKKCDVTMTHIESLSEFYLHVATGEKLHELHELLQMVHDHAQSTSGFKDMPSLGTLCVAMYSDGSWYRAQVVKIVNSETCVVHFFDFGNRETTSIFKMKPVTEKLLSFPVQALKCGLYGAAALGDANKESEAKNLFVTLVPLESIKTCRFMSRYPLLVDLECGSESPPLSVRDELARSSYVPKPVELGMTSLPTRKLPTESNFTVLLSEVKGPHDFWLQVLDEAVGKQLEALNVKIQHYGNGGGQGAGPASAPFLGQLCVANFSLDGMWYRSKVVEVVGGGKVKVQFIDFGNEEVVECSQVRPFKHEFMGLPAQAIHCSLVGFKVPSPSLSSKFVEMVENKPLIAINKSVPGEVCRSVVLIDTSESDDLYLHTALQ